MRQALLFILMSLCASAGVIDRIAITVGNQAITDSEITNDLRLTALMNATELNNSVEARQAAAGRLIEQALVRREMSFGSYPPVADSQIDEALENLEKARGGRVAFDRVLVHLDLTRKEVREYLTWQMQLLRFIDLRFRPAVQVTAEDIEKYYREHVVATHSAGKAPELNDVRSQIEQKLTGERVDDQLERWIKSSRARAVIRFQDASLESPSR
jgi:hypothetical protein